MKPGGITWRVNPDKEKRAEAKLWGTSPLKVWGDEEEPARDRSRGR